MSGESGLSGQSQCRGSNELAPGGLLIARSLVDKPSEDAFDPPALVERYDPRILVRPAAISDFRASRAGLNLRPRRRERRQSAKNPHACAPHAPPPSGCGV